MKHVPSIDEMLKAGMHFGHHTNRWHPKMGPYIYANKKGVYVIDLRKTAEMFGVALEFMARLASDGKSILFVGTKKQAKGPIESMAKEVGMPYVSGKWLGGFLTNFSVVKKSVRKYIDLVKQKELGKLDKYTKKERLKIDREIGKLKERVGGLVTLNKLPDAIFVWGLKEEATAIAEAQKRNIPIIGICDTNVDPSQVNYPIPANDDATKTIKLVMNAIRETLLEAQAGKK